ncbi:MAG: hypothetical protein FWD57_17345 [Polyangiaceae bacterium]|nr:hypothetical protein [Polyangiaceae bacterium]
MSTSWQLEWHGGGEAWVVETDGTRATLHSTRQAAVGTPLSAAVADKPGVTLRFKVKDCRRVEDGLFVLVGRWVDLSRALREELVQEVGLR